MHAVVHVIKHESLTRMYLGYLQCFGLFSLVVSTPTKLLQDIFCYLLHMIDN